MLRERLPAMALVHYNKQFGALMLEALGGLSLRTAAEQCKLSHTTLAGMVNGKVPRPDTLAQVLNGLSVGADLRTKLFHEAGYVEKRGAAASVPNEIDLMADAVEERMRKLLASYPLGGGSASRLIDGPTPPLSPYEALMTGIVELSREFNRAIPMSFDHSTFAELTHEGAEQQLAWLRGELEAGRI